MDERSLEVAHCKFKLSTSIKFVSLSFCVSLRLNQIWLHFVLQLLFFGNATFLTFIILCLNLLVADEGFYFSHFRFFFFLHTVKNVHPTTKNVIVSYVKICKINIHPKSFFFLKTQAWIHASDFSCKTFCS